MTLRRTVQGSRARKKRCASDCAHLPAAYSVQLEAARILTAFAIAAPLTDGARGATLSHFIYCHRGQLPPRGIPP